MCMVFTSLRTAYVHYSRHVLQTTLKVYAYKLIVVDFNIHLWTQNATILRSNDCMLTCLLVLEILDVCSFHTTLSALF